MRDYFYTEFPHQCARLSYAQPNDVADAAYGLAGVPFFGGRDWNNVATDLAAVPAADRTRFILALFMVVLTDQALYTYSPDAYEAWRRQTAFPKFGWSGFGIHNENPLKLLSVPEREGLVEPRDLIAAMPEFVDFLVAETKRVIATYGLAVSPASHFESIVQDPAYRFNEGMVVAAFKAAFEMRWRALRDA